MELVHLHDAVKQFAKKLLLSSVIKSHRLTDYVIAGKGDWRSLSMVVVLLLLLCVNFCSSVKLLVQFKVSMTSFEFYLIF